MVIAMPQCETDEREPERKVLFGTARPRSTGKGILYEVGSALDVVDRVEVFGRFETFNPVMRDLFRGEPSHPAPAARKADVIGDLCPRGVRDVGLQIKVWGHVDDKARTL